MSPDAATIKITALKRKAGEERHRVQPTCRLKPPPMHPPLMSPSKASGREERRKSPPLVPRRHPKGRPATRWLLRRDVNFILTGGSGLCRGGVRLAGHRRRTAGCNRPTALYGGGPAGHFAVGHCQREFSFRRDAHRDCARLAGDAAAREQDGVRPVPFPSIGGGQDRAAPWA
jgi:hypothetical protein